MSFGTRFLATPEMAVAEDWKQRIVTATALDAVKVVNGERVLPPFTLPQSGRPAAPRALRTDLTDALERDPLSVDAGAVGPRFVRAVRAGGGHDLLPFAGQSVELVHDVVPAAELVARLVREAETALERAAALVDGDRHA